MERKKIGLSIGEWQWRYGEKTALELAKEVGADCVDLDLCGSYIFGKEGNLYNRSDDEITSYFTEIGTYARSLGLEISQTHGRIRGLYGDPEEEERTLKGARLDCIATRALGAPVTVMHTCNTYRMGKDAPSEAMYQKNVQTMSNALRYAKEYGVLLATETFGGGGYQCIDFFGEAEHFLKGYADVAVLPGGEDHFTVCIDTGHCNEAAYYSQVTPAEFIRRVGAAIGGHKISVLHLHDNDGRSDQHKMPFSGSIDWKDTLDALDEVGYRGVYNLELKLSYYGKELWKEHAAFAIKVFRRFLTERYGNAAVQP